MELTGSIGMKGGFQFRYQNLIGEGRVTVEALKDLQPAMEQAVAAVRKIRGEGFSKAHLSKDGTPEHVYFPRQAYLEQGNPNDEESIERLEKLGAAWKDSVDAAVFIGIGGSYLGDKVILTWRQNRTGTSCRKKNGTAIPRFILQGIMWTGRRCRESCEP